MNTELLASQSLCIDVAVPVPVEGLFSYSVPPEWADKVKPGVRVNVPFRNRDITGYIVAQREAPAGVALKPIQSILDDDSVLSPKILELTRWISETYASSWGEAIENALPKWVKYGKKALKALGRAPAAEKIPDEMVADFALSGDQTRALDAITRGFDHPPSKPILLFGVTGSGKSEIYIRAIREVLRRGQSAICLVPEIALTEQIRFFFLKHFGSELEILHSKLGDAERFLAWKRLETGERRVVLGPRSAVFAPVCRLGLIIMDEEHEGSYKQETAPRYHARDVAAWRAGNEKALFVMGSATPSMEAMYKSVSGDYIRIDMRTRIDDKAMPKVEMLDLKEMTSTRRKMVILTPRLASEIEINLKKKEGTLLLLNRRGFSTHINCPKCGYVESCHSCQVTLTFHQEDEVLLCHYCNYQKPVSSVCVQCKMPLMRFAGFGTEKVESEIAAQFPAARIARLDADTVKKKGSHEVILKEFRDRKVDILIGTQMIAKGFDFPHVTLVGVILADVGLMLPDFRSAERTFQLLTQVAGRAGRGHLPGRVLIQTFSPDHPAIRFAKHHDYVNFYAHESKERQEFRYPPFSRLINIIIRGRDENKTYVFARGLRDTLTEALFPGRKDLIANRPGPSEIEIIGPAPLPFYKLRGHFRWHVMLKIPHESDALKTIRSSLSKLKKVSQIAFAVDVDPLNIL